jgi:hypothetical protein
MIAARRGRDASESSRDRVSPLRQTSIVVLELQVVLLRLTLRSTRSVRRGSFLALSAGCSTMQDVEVTVRIEYMIGRSKALARAWENGNSRSTAFVGMVVSDCYGLKMDHLKVKEANIFLVPGDPAEVAVRWVVNSSTVRRYCRTTPCELKTETDRTLRLCARVRCRTSISGRTSNARARCKLPASSRGDEDSLPSNSVRIRCE